LREKISRRGAEEEEFAEKTGRFHAKTQSGTQRRQDEMSNGEAKSPASILKPPVFSSCPLSRCLPWERDRVRVFEDAEVVSTEKRQRASQSWPVI
jgi:hypothetical protein